MVATQLFSLSVGGFSGILYASAAYRQYKMLITGAMPPAFSVRAGLIFLRIALAFAFFALVSATGLVLPVWTGAGVAIGYFGFYFLLVVMKWM